MKPKLDQLQASLDQAGVDLLMYGTAFLQLTRKADGSVEYKRLSPLVVTIQDPPLALRPDQGV